MIDVAIDQVVAVDRGTWKPEDAYRLVVDAKLIGRATVRMRCGAVPAIEMVVDAIVVASQRGRDLGTKYAVFFHPEDSRLIALRMETRS